MRPRLLILILLLLPLLLGTSCKQKTRTPADRERLRVLIPPFYKGQIQQLMDSNVRAFSSRFEDVEWVDMPSYSGRDEVFAASLAARFSDSDPDADVFFIDLFRIGSFRPGWLTRFDIRDAFRPAFLKAAQLGDDAVYAVPWSAKGNFLFYRKDLIARPPRTFAELKQACAAIPFKRLHGVRYCLLLDWDSIHNDLYPALWSLSGDGPIDLRSDAAVGFFEELATMLGEPVHTGVTVLPSASQIAEVGRKTHKRFAKGEAVFMINWNNRFGYMQSEVGARLPPIGIAPIPTVADGGTPFSNIGSWGWIVPRASDGASEAALARHRLALKFVEEVSSAEAVRYFVGNAGVVPARKDVAMTAGLRGVLSAPIVAALEGDSTGLRFRDRGSDSFVHTFVRDAIRDIFMCRTAATKPLPTEMLGDCARYLEECSQHESDSTECFSVAVRRRLEAAQRDIEAARR